jgi:putative membrane protein
LDRSQHAWALSLVKVNVMRYRFLAGIVGLFAPPAAGWNAVWAHVPRSLSAEPAIPQSIDDLWESWSLEATVVVPLLLGGILYGVGVARIWRRAGLGHGMSRGQAVSFASGWLTLVVALVSPLHAWGNALFSVHMLQHELLMLIAAPLVVLGKPVVASLQALPASWRPWLLRAVEVRPWRVFWDWVTHPLIAWAVHAFVLWVWHAPVLFEAAVHSEWIHALQHVSFFLSALLFWWAVLEGQPRAIASGVGVLFLFTTALHSGLLGALITFAPRPWYPVYRETTSAWGLTALEDQQLGGLIMWVPACAVYIVAGLILFAAWLRACEQRARHLGVKSDAMVHSA